MVVLLEDSPLSTHMLEKIGPKCHRLQWVGCQIFSLILSFVWPADVAKLKGDLQTAEKVG